MCGLRPIYTTRPANVRTHTDTLTQTHTHYKAVQICTNTHTRDIHIGDWAPRPPRVGFYGRPSASLPSHWVISPKSRAPPHRLPPTAFWGALRN